jgi:hypothetical protein
MTDPNLTHLSLVVDRSGSMVTIASDMNGAVSTLLRDQQSVPGRLSVDVVTFDQTVEFVGTDLSIADAIALGDLVQPRGMTAMFDAIGAAVTSLGDRLGALDEAKRPGKVMVVIVTDGEENSSREWQQDAVKDLITRQRDDYSWEFVFLGANIDAVTVAKHIGIPRGSTMTYAASAAGVDSAVASLSGMTSMYRTTGNTGSFTEDERTAATQ